MNSRRYAFGLGFLLIFLMMSCIMPAQDQASLKKLIKNSEIIVIGNVKSIHSKWNDTNTKIYSDIIISPEEFLKGDSELEIKLKLPGGEVGSIGEFYTHIPTFTRNEKVLLFINKNNSGQLKTIDGSRGKFSLSGSTIAGESSLSQKIKKNELIELVKRIVSQPE